MKKLLIIILVAGLFAHNGNKDEQKIKRLSESTEASENTTFIVNVSNGSDVMITNSSDGKIHLNFTLEVTEENDRNYMVNIPDDFQLLKKNGTRITLDTESIFLLLAEEHRPGFFEKLFSGLGSGKEGSISTINGVTKYVKDGRSYIIPSHIMTIELKVPKIKLFKHKNKYGTSIIEDMDADYNELHLYETNLTIKNMKGDLDVVDKYAEVKIENIEGDMDAEFYELDGFVTNVSGNLRMTNKYSKMSVSEIKGKADITAYELILDVENVGKDLKIVNKYDDTKITNVGGNVLLELYESSLTMDEVKGDVNINSKYDPVNVQNIEGALKVSFYESDFDAKNIGKDITGEMKYGHAYMENVGGNLELSGYEIKYRIKNTKDIMVSYKYGDMDISGEFGEIDLDSYEGDLSIRKAKADPVKVNIIKKYGKISLSGFEYSNYRIKAKAKHAKIRTSELDDELMDDRDELKYQWSQKDKKTMYIDGYSTEISLD